MPKKQKLPMEEKIHLVRRHPHQPGGAGRPNHAGNWCYAAFMYDTKKKMLHSKLLQRYYHHFSHYIAPGAKRVALSTYTGALEAAAFQNPNGTAAIVLFNAGKAALPINLRLNGQLTELTLEEQTMISGALYL